MRRSCCHPCRRRRPPGRVLDWPGTATRRPPLARPVAAPAATPSPTATGSSASSAGAAWPPCSSPRTSSTTAGSPSRCSTPRSPPPSAPSASCARSRPSPGSPTRTSCRCTTPGVADGLLFYVMPYVEGESLRDRLTREKQLPLEDALRIAREVADALGYAHAPRRGPPRHQAREHPARGAGTRWWRTSASRGRSAPRAARS